MQPQKISSINNEAIKERRIGKKKRFAELENRKVVVDRELVLYFIISSGKSTNRAALEFHKTACLIWRMSGGESESDEYCYQDDELIHVEKAALKIRFGIEITIGV